MSAQISRMICAHGGAMNYDDVLAGVRFDTCALNDSSDNFHIVVLNGRKRMIAKTNVRLCKARMCDNCSNLHLCKFYLFGDCKNIKERGSCRFCHNLSTEHNSRVLREHSLQGLDRTQLCTLLLQNDSTLLPPVCFLYNQGSGEYGNCKQQDSCTKLHICQKYVKGTCSSGVECSRSHDFYEPHPLKTLQGRGIPPHLIAFMLSVYQNIQALKIANNPKKGRDPSPEKTDICVYFVKGSCKFGDKCRRLHFNMPYKWEVKTPQGWSTLSDNEEVEKDFCNPCKTYSRGIEPVCFDTMTRGLSKVRRLSTVSSVLQPTLFLTTKWAWYWEDEYGNWVQYASSNGGYKPASITSEVLEQEYLKDSATVVEFTAGSQSYQLNFQDMIQKNKQYGTKKLVQRRPVFMSSTDIQKIKTSKTVHRQPNSKALPAHWDKSQVTDTGYKKITLLPSWSEYKEILALFRKTMLGFSIRQIERIQNKALWEVFQWQKELMKKNNGGRDCEKLLFHGTDSKHVDAICQQNFDWRICGTHGTAYGKGSYFARDAKYSHGYTKSSGNRTMFVCRVLVGEYTEGDSSYLRPPSKDGGDVHFYDSCVDDIYNPSIYVVFEKHQVYPEYLIQYYEDMCHPHGAYNNYSNVPLRPRAAPQPAPSAAHYPSYSSINSSASISSSDSNSSCVIS
ncbi:protein mono-ADP-ribosyltransferase PARP12 [Brienomyrus brachyistius]|uniref:protein mono-ADP-ribosyltransferase PARP12 n=1 Tax=Brienomyrus brachyistius TaxID=42636 RepID=UPI0020B27D34|nr:protein mono-ADP-ribosyltransferase PARP12 [Brienomyrus brachyistius]